jgi:hypothetical protein
MSNKQTLLAQSFTAEVMADGAMSQTAARLRANFLGYGLDQVEGDDP